MNDPNAEQHWAVAMAEIVCYCAYIFCTICTDADTEADLTPTIPRSRPRQHIRRSLPSTSSIMDMLYPSSYLGSPPTFPDPPSYFSEDTHPYAARGNRGYRTESAPLISSTTTTPRGTLLPSGHHDLLVIEPLPLTGIPSPRASSRRVPQAEPNAPVVGLGIDVLQEVELPPAYSYFDESRSRLPVASDRLGPYPHISVLSPRAR